MKTLFSILLSVACAVSALAQGFTPTPTAPVCTSAFTNGIGVVVIAGSTTSNLPTSMVTAFSVGKTGFGFGATLAGTNSVSTTNAIFTFEISGNGTDYALNNRPAASFPQLGTGYATYYTNFVATTPILDNAILVRMRTIQNTNLDSIFITNTCLNTR